MHLAGSQGWEESNGNALCSVQDGRVRACGRHLRTECPFLSQAFGVATVFEVLHVEVWGGAGTATSYAGVGGRVTAVVASES